MTDKNENLLLTLDDPRLLAALVQLPDRLWRQARRALLKKTAFLTIQTALAIDILLHVPLRLQNLAQLEISQHLHWPRGPGKPALIKFGSQETKTSAALKFEPSAGLSDRLQAYRNEIAPAVIGSKPDKVFVTYYGKSKNQASIAIAIRKAILRYLGIRMTPHQFRHLCAKVILDRNPGAYELVKQMLGLSNVKTTANFYAGINTLRAGRAHANLINELRETNWDHRHRQRRRRPAEE